MTTGLPLSKLWPRAGEYSSILRAASNEGWLSPLLAAHFEPASHDDAKRLISWVRESRIEGGLAYNFSLRFGRRSGRATFHAQEGRYTISLPKVSGSGCGKLRIGIILHEIAHVLDRQKSGTFGHQKKYQRVLRSLVTKNWRQQVMSRGTLREIYNRHDGPFHLVLTREMTPGGKQFADTINGPLSSKEAHEKARAAVQEPGTIDCYVYSDGEGHFTGAVYERGKAYDSWEAMSLAEAPASEPQPEAPAAPSKEEPSLIEEVKQALAPRLAQAAGPKPKRSRGGLLELDLGNAERWPDSKGAALVREALEAGPASVADLSARLAEPLKAAGVAFPASLISRLKQAGFIRSKEA